MPVITKGLPMGRFFKKRTPAKVKHTAETLKINSRRDVNSLMIGEAEFSELYPPTR